jgi:hypothetical protein
VPLNPDAFDSEEEFKQARFAEGLRLGFKPVFAYFPISKEISKVGKRIVETILKK